MLLDTNIWSYAASVGGGARLEQIARKRRLQIVAAPSVVYEAVRTSDRVRRRQLASILTRPSWKTLMPEAFEVCEEFCREVARIRPHWIRKRDYAKEQWRTKNIMDWKRGRGSLWDRVRLSPDEVARHVSAIEGDLLDAARCGAGERRRIAMEAGWRFEGADLDGTRARYERPIAGWNGEDVASWRASAMAQATNDFLNPPYSEWLGGCIDMTSLVGTVEWVSFWLHDAEQQNLPRWWIAKP